MGWMAVVRSIEAESRRERRAAIASARQQEREALRRRRQLLAQAAADSAAQDRRTAAMFDNYLELVKARRYGDLGAEGAGSANAAMLVTLGALLRLFAPFLPFVTEEVWSWWKEGSVHRASWPTADEILAAIGGSGDPTGTEALAMASWALGEIRRAKSEAKKK